ncbi:glutathione peroxidase [Aciduricibacillus chroicocephali]|uniref:Glutathione peroxidase n=1 Tax=Aciduricibacillus chroicocephali TaxID=3054939 RepID=A0ABY9KWL7_9BACI|nr:glutathione peroxidase [Bacillaceae bacterium 44XB]
MSVYKYSIESPDGTVASMDTFQGDVLLIVNTATGCGFAPQLEALEALYQKYKSRGFHVLGFPCNQFMNQEPLSDRDISTQCNLNYGTTFPFYKKVNVKGPDVHPLFKYLTEKTSGLLGEKIKWNFTKFLVDRNGNVVKRFAPVTKPEKIGPEIERLL